MSLHNLGRIALPYCLELLDDNCIRLLHREYHPIGCTTQRGRLDDDLQQRTKIKLQPSDIAKLKELSVHPIEDNRVYFYDDNTCPEYSSKLMNTYLKKINTLYSMEVTRC